MALEEQLDAYHQPRSSFRVHARATAQRSKRRVTSPPSSANSFTASGLPRHLGTLHGRHVRHLLHQLAAPVEEHVLGFPGASAPYWEFEGDRPSVALIVATRGPQLFRRHEDGTTWVRFGWERDDVWLVCADDHATRSLVSARRERLAGKEMATALGFKPHYLLTALSRPIEGHCYKTCVAILPRG